jgi:hypothetical protein
MKNLKRLLYLGYYLKTTEWKKFQRFFNAVKREKEITSFSLFIDIISSSVKYNISFLEYFYFRFFNLDKNARSTYAGTGYMYEYQRAMNPLDARACLDDKIAFYELYAPFVRHQVASLSKLENESGSLQSILSNASEKIVLKDSHGKCGVQVKVFSSSQFTPATLLKKMEIEKFDLAEEYVVQHPDLMKLSPSGLNTVRIFTQLNSAGEVEYLGARLRISINSHIDNMAAGNIAAPIDIESGVVTGPGVYSDITKTDEYTHPVTGIEIVGFQIPHWQEVKKMIEKAAKHNPSNRSIGWDIAVTAMGPELIEGNHDWCKLVWQLPVKKGMKDILEKHLQELTLV